MHFFINFFKVFKVEKLILMLVFIKTLHPLLSDTKFNIAYPNRWTDVAIRQILKQKKAKPLEIYGFVLSGMWQTRLNNRNPFTNRISKSFGLPFSLILVLFIVLILWLFLIY